MRILLLLLLGGLTSIANAQRNPIDERNKNYGSKEILLLNVDSATQSKTTQRLFNFNWKRFLSNPPGPLILQKVGPTSITNSPTTNNHTMVAEAADLNGDGLDEPIYLLERTGSWQVVIGNIASSADTVNRTYNFTIGLPVYQTGISNGTFSTNPNKYYPVLVTGNFDSDTQSEFAVAFKDPTTSRLKIQLFDTDGQLNPIARASISGDTSVFLGFGDAYNMTAADLNADGKDELVLIAAEQNNNGTSFPYSLYLKSYEVNSGSPSTITLLNKQVLNNNMVNTGINQNDPDLLHSALSRVRVYNPDGTAANDRIVASYYFLHQGFGNNYFNNFTYLMNPGTSGFTIADIDSVSNKTDNDIDAPITVRSGDFDGNGPHEVVVRVGSCNVYTVRNDSLIFKTSFAGSNVSGWVCGLDGMEMSDVDADGKDEVVLFSNFTNASGNTRRFNFRVVGDAGDQVSHNIDEQTGFSNTMSALALGNFDGSDFRLGIPKVSDCYYSMPVMIIGTVPTHYDYLNGTEYDICDCWRSPANCLFNVTTSNTSSVDFTNNVTVQSDWSVTAGVSAGVSLAGVEVSASMEGTYGQNFSNEQLSTSSFSVTVDANTTNDDMLKILKYPLTVYEYPVTNKAGQTIDYILAAFPKNQNPTNLYIPSRSLPTYLPDHEVGNILSYPSDAGYTGIPDFATDSGSNRATILPLGTATAYQVSSGASYSQTVTSASSFGTTNSNSWNAGITAEVSASGFGVGANVSGTYNTNSLNISSQTVSTTSDLVFRIGSLANSTIYDYTVSPRIYWNNDGAVKVNWKVDPTTISGSFWNSNYGNKSDPAIILPWRHEPRISGMDPSNPLVDRTKSMYFTPANPSMWDTVTVHLKLFNYSMTSLNDSTDVSFYFGDPATGGNVITGLNGRSVIKVPPIGARSRRTVSMQFVVSDTLLKKIYVVVDPANRNANEVHEDNNKGWAYLGYECNNPDVLIGIEDIQITKESIDLKVYPNPSTNELKLSFKPVKAEKVTVEVYDFFGRKVDLVYEDFLPSETVIVSKDMNSLTPGVYFVRLRSDSGMDVMGRWIKM